MRCDGVDRVLEANGLQQSLQYYINDNHEGDFLFRSPLLALH